MYTNQYTIDNLLRQKDRIDEMIHNYQNPQPINNFINTSQTPSKTFVEWRILNETEEVDNLYVQNKTLFISDKKMVLKDVDGKLEKWDIKKVYPIDEKDKKINDLEEEVKKLKEMINNEPSKSNVTIGEFDKSNVNANGDAEPKSKTNDRYVQKQK